MENCLKNRARFSSSTAKACGAVGMHSLGINRKYRCALLPGRDRLSVVGRTFQLGRHYDAEHAARILGRKLDFHHRGIGLRDVQSHLRGGIQRLTLYCQIEPTIGTGVKRLQAERHRLQIGQQLFGIDRLFRRRLRRRLCGLLLLDRRRLRRLGRLERRFRDRRLGDQLLGRVRLHGRPRCYRLRRALAVAAAP